MIYNDKRNYPVEIDDYVTSEFLTLTARADISLKEAEAAVKVSISDIITRNVVLNSNITVNDTSGYEANGVVFESGSNNPQTPSIYSGMAAKTTKVTMKNSSVDSFANGWYSYADLKVGGAIMRLNFNISSIATHANSSANAVGIFGYDIISDADFRSNFTVASQADSYAYGFGVNAAQALSAGDFSGKFKISAKSAKEMVRGAGIFAAGSLSLEKLSGSMDINTAGNYAFGYALKGGTVSIARGFTGSLSVKNNSAMGNIYGFQADSSLVFGGRTTGSITVNNQLKNSGSAYGIQADIIGLTNYSGNINVKATAQKDSDGMVESYGITGTQFFGFGGFTGDLTVAADNKSINALSEAQAYGISAYFAFFEGVTGKWNITANGCTATAYGIKADNYMNLGDFTGNKSVAAKGNIARSTLLYAEIEDIYARNISGKLQVTSTGTACGFNSWSDLIVQDMSKMDLQVSGLNAKAIDAGGYVVLSKSGLDLGKITVKGDDEGTGIACGNISTTVVDINNTSVVLNDRLEGTVSVTGKNYDAYGIQVAEGIEAVLSSNITATGKTSAHAVQFKDGDLTIDNAKITAKVTDKGKAAYAYAIQVIEFGDELNNNNITITGNSVLTGLVSLGKGTDKVTIESGSKVIGGFTGVEGLTLQINDAKQKNNVLWQATEATSQTYVSVQVEYGLLGDFKIISKDKNIEWTELFSDDQYANMDNYLHWYLNEELYTYGLYKKGNDLYVSAMFKKALGDNAEIFETKSTAPAKTNKEYTAFTDKADIKVADEMIALDASKSGRLVLDNNITIKSTWSDVYGVQLAVDNAVLISNNAAKTLNVANSGSPDVKNATVAGYTSSNKIKIQGGKFLQNITVSGKNEEADTLSVAGIAANTINSSDAVIAGNFNITGKAANKLDTWGIKTENSDLSKIKDISGKFNVSADTGGNTVTAIGVQALALTMDKFSGKMTIESSGNADYGVYSFAAGLYTTWGDLNLTDGFSGSINVNAKDKHQVIAYGMAGGKKGGSSNADLILGGKNTGAITVTADGVQAATATGIYCKNFIALSNYSGAITAKATANGDDETSATAIDQAELNKGITCVGAFSSKLNVTALNKNKGKGTTYATGISAQSNITMDDITGNWNITATGCDAGAYGLYTVNSGNISVHDISGNITIKATSYNKNSTVSSYAFHAIDSFSANRISGKITVSATAGARGFYAYDRFAVTDMSKMNLSVSGSYAYGIEVKESLEVASTGLNLGKITVNAKGNAWGVNVSKNIYYDKYASVLNNRLEGNITVKSQNGSAYGIDADAFAQYKDSVLVENNTEVICSATVSVTGKSSAYGVYFYDGDLTLDNATITAKVTDKTSSEYANAVYAATGNNNIYITGKSKITGNIRSYDGTDKVSIESGSKLVGGITGFEVVELIIDDAATAKQALWDVTDDFTGELELDIKFDYGMSGDFMLATKKSDILWEDVFDFSDVSLWINGNKRDMTYGVCTYEDFDYELKAQGDKLLLAATEKI